MSLYCQDVARNAKFTARVAPSNQTAGHSHRLLRIRLPHAAYSNAVVSRNERPNAVWRRVGIQCPRISEFLLPNHDLLKPEFELYRKWTQAALRHSRRHTSDASRNLGVPENSGQTRSIASGNHADFASGRGRRCHHRAKQPRSGLFASGNRRVR